MAERIRLEQKGLRKIGRAFRHAVGHGQEVRANRLENLLRGRGVTDATIQELRPYITDWGGLPYGLSPKDHRQHDEAMNRAIASGNRGVFLVNF